ncbi:ESX secretion-associated protein EspG [Actinokineospora fastidiosa]|uniref:ESX secretion-associated protein EspG n=1 Tax=Actinokineospora fastidiosa TaxID=1816 RepID=A0A918L7K7_9PSEU|nr:ESX secretion-associated protein EspG [Actinokineospora fastidiosa]GGS16249.1 ESX secretion-associated protein EspG [Actinokineospora fastidiosa]
MLDRPLKLSVNTVARTVKAEGLGQLHLTISPEALWFPRDEERRAEQMARDELARAGGIDQRGRVDADMLAVLAMLCTPRAEFYGWISQAKRTVGVLVAVTGRTAVLVRNDDGVVSIVPVNPEAPAEALVAQTPEVPPGRGQVITVFGEDVRSAAGGRQRTATGVGTRQAPPQVREVQRITELPTTGGGQLFTAVRDSAGRRHKVPAPLRYADTVQGRYLNLALPGDRVLIGPADRRALAQRLYEMHRGLTTR